MKFISWDKFTEARTEPFTFELRAPLSALHEIPSMTGSDLTLVVLYQRLDGETMIGGVLILNGDQEFKNACIAIRAGEQNSVQVKALPPSAEFPFAQLTLNQ